MRNRRFGGVARPLARTVACSMLVSAALAHGQEEKQQRLKMEPLVVEAPALFPERSAGENAARRELERVPGGTALVPESDYRRSRAFNMKDALEFVPGVLVRPRFGSDESQVSIRGSGLRNNFHLRGVNVLIDGFPFGNADGFSDPESFELLSTKRVEVYKGANALRFGAGSIGGAINFVSRTGADVAPAEVTSEGGSFGYHKHSIATGTAVDGWDLFALFTNTELDGYRDHSDQRRRRGVASLGHTTEGGTAVRLDVGFVENQNAQPGSLTKEQLEDDPEQANAASVANDERHDYDYGRAALSAWIPIADDQSIEMQAQANLQDLDHPLSFAILTGDTWSWGAESRYRREDELFGRALRLTIGVQYAGTSTEDVRFEPLGNAVKGAKVRDQRNEAWTIGVYGEEQIAVTEALELVVGGRFQHSDRSVDPKGELGSNGRDDSTDFQGVTPKVGLLYRVTTAMQIYGNVSRAYEPPLLFEIASPQDLDGRLDDLDAQKAWQFEIGTRGHWGDRFVWDVSVYDLELRDELLNVNVQPFPGAPFTIPRYRNVDESRHTGAEIGGDLVLARGLVRPDAGKRGDELRWRLSYTWSRFVFVDDDEFGSNDLPGAPVHFLRSEMRWTSGNGLWLSPGMEAVPEGYAVDSANDNETDRYVLFSFGIGYDYEPWGLAAFFEGRNVLDATYASSVVVDAGDLRFFEPGDGRAFYGGVRWTWS